MRKTSLIVVAAVIVLALLLNPSAERHRSKIRDTIAERNPIAGILGVGALTAFTTGYYSLGIVSYTKANDRIVSIGVMGMVFVL
jgi:hypothetical protein